MATDGTGPPRVGRRGFLKTVTAAGAYGLIDKLVERPARASRAALGSLDPELAAVYEAIAPAGRLPAEQHLFLDSAIVFDNHVAVVVPPLHHQVVTATLRVAPGQAALAKAQAVLEGVLSRLEAERLLTFTPAGLGVAVGWGLAYFERRLPASLTAARLPIDLRASEVAGKQVGALLDAQAFPSDNATALVLEDNEVVFVMASDSLGHLDDAHHALFGSGPAHELFEVTSVRKGFVDGRRIGTKAESLIKAVALAARVPGAGHIPRSAEMFLGFTSTQRSALGPTRIANLETLPGITDQWPHGYFRYGTTLHLSHLYEDLEAWYLGSNYEERIGLAFTPRFEHRYPRGTQTVAMPASSAFDVAEVKEDLAASQIVGHSTTMQPVSRLRAAVRDNYGAHHVKGTSIPQRGDFNTLDNPFHFSSDHLRDRWSPKPAAGVHFLTYMPSSDSFDRVRLAMDGNYPGGASLGPAGPSVGINTVITATHRQNFLVPPRAHRSFPLSELW